MAQFILWGTVEKPGNWWKDVGELQEDCCFRAVMCLAELALFFVHFDGGVVLVPSLKMIVFSKPDIFQILPTCFFCKFLIVDFVGRFFQCWSRERGNTMFFQICHEMSGTWQLQIEWGETVRLTPNVWEDCRNRGHKKPIPAMAKGWHSSWPCWAFAR